MKKFKVLISTLGVAMIASTPVIALTSCGSNDNSSSILAPGDEPVSFSSLPSNVKKFYEDHGIKGNVKSIPPYAFANAVVPKNFKMITSVMVIENNAFSGATFKGDLHIPSSVRDINEFVFSDTTFEGKLELPSSINKIQDSTFFEATLPDDFTLPNSITSIDNQAFRLANLGPKFQLPNSLKMIDSFAFSGASLSSTFKIPSSVKSIENNSFDGATLPADYATNDYYTYVGLLSGGYIIPDSHSIIAPDFTIPKDAVVSSNAFVDAVFPPNFKTSDYYTFFHLMEGGYANYVSTIADDFTIPSDVQKIVDGLFDNAILPSAFRLPNTIKTIGIDAFAEATIPLGFEIPSEAIVDQTAFEDATLPAGAHWSKTATDPEGNEYPLPGAVVVI